MKTILWYGIERLRLCIKVPALEKSIWDTIKHFKNGLIRLIENKLSQRRM